MADNTGGDTHVSTMYDVGDDEDAWPVEIVLAGSAVDLYHDAEGGQEAGVKKVDASPAPTRRCQRERQALL